MHAVSSPGCHLITQFNDDVMLAHDMQAMKNWRTQENTVDTSVK